MLPGTPNPISHSWPCMYSPRSCRWTRLQFFRQCLVFITRTIRGDMHCQAAALLTSAGSEKKFGEWSQATTVTSQDTCKDESMKRCATTILCLELVTCGEIILK
eukprot:4577026-Amphidinium_carterae.1